MLAAVNNEVILVTTTEASHIECCKLLDGMIHCDSVKVPESLCGATVTTASIALEVKQQKMKYLALQLDVS